MSRPSPLTSGPPLTAPFSPRAQTLLVKSPEIGWYAALTTSFCLAAKILSEDRVFAIDAAHFTQRYQAADLIELETLAVTMLLPSIAHMHERAFVFRTSLLDLAIDSANAPVDPNPTCLHVLIVDDNEYLRSYLGAVAQDAAPNATIHFTDSRAGARHVVNKQNTAGAPIQLVLLGEIDSLASAEDAPKLEIEALVSDLDPRQGSLCDDMRNKPLIATMAHSVLARSGYHGNGIGVDAVMTKPLNASSLHVLLDFAAID